MELFSINRYNDEEVAKDPEKEDKILKKLFEKAERRKRKLEKVKEIGEPSPDGKTDKKIGDVEVNSKKLEIETKQIDCDKVSTGVNDVKKQKADNERNDIQILCSNIQKKQKIHMVLPPWLAYPTIITNKITNDKSIKNIDDLGYLSYELKEQLKLLKIEKLFPVQSKVIPWVLNAHSKPTPFRPRDICVSAPTGSGKTLAFAIPIVQLLCKRVERKVRALIVLPVNELALQVYHVFKYLTAKTKLSVCLLSKSLPLAIEQQNLVECFNGKYYSKVDIIVTTPGRLVEHLHSTNGFCLNSLMFLVIDEADRIMEQIHHNWLYHLDNHVKDTSESLYVGKSVQLCLNNLENIACRQPHKLLFSATLSQDPEKLQNLRLFQPKLFTSVVVNVNEIINEMKEKATSNQNENTNNEIRGEFIGKYTTPAELTEKYCITESQLKPLTLFSLIEENSWNKFLCFTNSAESAHRLAFVLQKLIKNGEICEISASLKSSSRTEILNKFAVGKIKGLISSDALARGIDIPDVDIVISYELPRHVKTYIHRIGRTARAGRPGTAITLFSIKELTTFKKILADAGKEITEEIKVESNLEVENAKLFFNTLKDLKKKLEGEKRIKSLHKDIITKKATITANIKDSGPMSLMERLQVQAHDIVADQLKETIKMHDKRSNKRKK